MKEIIEKDQQMLSYPTMATQESESSGSKYPYYNIQAALRMAEAVKDLGGAKSPVKKSMIAKQLGAEENASSFAQGLASARSFGLLGGRGDYGLTEISKRYYFPTTDLDRMGALLDAFASPSSFSDLLKRFDGDKLPTREILSNILHRDFGVPESWKDRVASLFSSSAQFIGIIDSQGIIRFDANRHSTGTEPPVPISSQPVHSQTPSAPIVERRPTVVGKVNWHYKSIEVITPEDLDYPLWKKLEGYVKLLEPPES